MAKWGFKEGRAFNGLIPKVNEILGEVIGLPKEEVVTSTFDNVNNGQPQLEVVDVQAIALSDVNGGEEEHDFTKPDEKPNTPEEDETANNIVNQITAATGTTTVKIDVPSGETINNVTIPSDSTHYLYVSGNCADGATITNNSNKGMSINVTNEEPVDIVIDGTSTATTTLHGSFNNIYTTTPLSLSSTDKVYGTITYADDYTGNVSLTADFQDGSMVQTMTTGSVTINNQGSESSFEVYAPNADVTINGKCDEVTVTADDDTLYLKDGCYIKKLIMLKGNVKYYGFEMSDFIGEYVGKGNVEPMMWDVPTDVQVSKMTGNSGTYNIVGDITTGSSISFGIFGAGHFKYNLNGHELNIGNKNYSLFMRGNPTIDIYGDGKFKNQANGYLVWLSGENSVLNIYGGEYEGYTHTLYSEKGTINVYGGVFKLADAVTADRDVNGNLKFLLNCLDTNYTAGTANINVFGGKFYEFNPAVSYSEPNGPISFVAEGYGVIETVEDGKKVYEVVPIDN